VVTRGPAKTEAYEFAFGPIGRGKDLSGIKCFLLSRHRPYFSKVEDYRGEYILAQIMTTKEIAKYLKLHQITICKLSKEGKIPAIQIGRVWRFDKEIIDEWIARGEKN
jgi:excisionase family DNA binding protein